MHTSSAHTTASFSQALVSFGRTTKCPGNKATDAARAKKPQEKSYPKGSAGNSLPCSMALTLLLVILMTSSRVTKEVWEEERERK